MVRYGEVAGIVLSCSCLLLVSNFAEGACIDPSRGSEANPPKLLVVSFDGFRFDYLHRYKCPNFMRLAESGVWATQGMKPAFVSKTFPNHFTLVTGLYEESHGIVDNDMYDPLLNETFRIGNLDPKWWDVGAEPIWITTKRNGLKTASLFWAGSEAVIKGQLPDITLKYDSKMPFEDRVETVVRWFTEDNVDVAVMYFHEPDRTGHQTGVFNENLEKMLKYVDSTLGLLLDKLSEKSFLESTNLVIVSDHGMANVTLDEEHVISLEKYIDFSKYIQMVPQTGPVAGILPRPGKTEEVYQILKNAHPKMTVYKKEEVPWRFHYKNHRRIMPIVATAELGYVITDKYPPDFDKLAVGDHGYDNDYPEMRAIFLASGPSFKKNHTVDVFQNVHIYPLMCHVLNITPAPSNGSVCNIQDVLTEKYKKDIKC